MKYMLENKMEQSSDLFQKAAVNQKQLSRENKTINKNIENITEIKTVKALTKNKKN